MGIKSFDIFKQAWGLFQGNRREILAVGLFPLAALFLHDLASQHSPAMSALLSLPLAFLLVPFKIDLMRLAVLGEKPAGGYAQRLFKPRELRFFLYETSLTLAFVVLGMLVALIGNKAYNSWEVLGLALRAGSLLAIGVLVFAAFYYLVPVTLFFPGLSVDRALPVRAMFAEAAPHRLKIFFLMFWIFAAIMAVTAALPGQGPQPDAPDGSAGLVAPIINILLSLAGNIAASLAVGLLFVRVILGKPAGEDPR